MKDALLVGGEAFRSVRPALWQRYSARACLEELNIHRQGLRVGFAYPGISESTSREYRCPALGTRGVDWKAMR